jgi:hypothetical protein
MVYLIGDRLMLRSSRPIPTLPWLTPVKDPVRRHTDGGVRQGYLGSIDQRQEGTLVVLIEGYEGSQPLVNILVYNLSLSISFLVVGG